MLIEFDFKYGIKLRQLFSNHLGAIKFFPLNLLVFLIRQSSPSSVFFFFKLNSFHMHIEQRLLAKTIYMSKGTLNENRYT